MAVSYIWWWASTSGQFWHVECLFIAITPKVVVPVMILSVGKIDQSKNNLCSIEPYKKKKYTKKVIYERTMNSVSFPVGIE